MTWIQDTGIAAAAVLSFSNSLHGDFTLDDDGSIVQNPDVTVPGDGVFNDESLRALWAHDFWGKELSDPSSHKSWRPLTTLSFRAQHALSGLALLPLHTVNVALHALASVLLARLCRRHAFGRAGADAAALAALLFAAHPVHVEAVASLTGRADTLCAVFFVSALLLLLPARLHRAPLRAAGGLALAAGALLCKETGAMAPALAAAWFALRGWAARPAGRGAGPELASCAAALGAALALAAFRLQQLHGAAPTFQPVDNPAAAALAAAPAAGSAHAALEYALNLLHLWGRHLLLLLWPWPLCCDYSGLSIPLLRGRDAAELLESALSANHAVPDDEEEEGGEDSGASDADNDEGSDESDEQHTRDDAAASFGRYARAFVVCVFAAAGIGVSRRRNADWRDDFTLYSSAVAVAPNNGKMWHGLGSMLAAKGRWQAAADAHARSYALQFEGALGADVAARFDAHSDGGGASAANGAIAAASRHVIAAVANNSSNSNSNNVAAFGAYTWQASDHRAFARVLSQLAAAPNADPATGHGVAEEAHLRVALHKFAEHPLTLQALGNLLWRRASSAAKQGAGAGAAAHAATMEAATLLQRAVAAFEKLMPARTAAPPPANRLLALRLIHARYSALTKQYPEYVRALLALGAAEEALGSMAWPSASSDDAGARRQGHHRRAEGAYIKALNVAPHEWSATHNVVALRQQRGDAVGALDVLKLFVEPGRGRTNREIMGQYRIMTGMAHFMLHDHDSAAHWLTKALERNPRNALAQMAMALVRMRQGDLVAAEAHSKRAEAIDANDVFVRANLGNVRDAIKKHGLVGEGREAKLPLWEAATTAPAPSPSVGDNKDEL
eukprot:g736.t1